MNVAGRGEIAPKVVLLLVRSWWDPLRIQVVEGMENAVLPKSPPDGQSNEPVPQPIRKPGNPDHQGLALPAGVPASLLVLLIQVELLKDQDVTHLELPVIEPDLEGLAEVQNILVVRLDGF